MVKMSWQHLDSDLPLPPRPQFRGTCQATASILVAVRRGTPQAVAQPLARMCEEGKLRLEI